MRHKVEEARSNLEATKNRGDVLDGLMMMKNSGKIPGILGRLVGVFNVHNNAFHIIVVFSCIFVWSAKESEQSRVSFVVAVLLLLDTLRHINLFPI